MKRNSKRMLIGGGTLAALLLLGEVGLRMYGFGNAPLYRESDKYEYMCLPNQDIMRFGNHIHYNSYSQRSEEPDSTRKKVLGLGDSVIYGGVQIDQDDIATSLFTKETGIQMLNISAGSWGPDNCAAYLKEKGTFGASAMFLVVSSHDAHDNIDHQPVVGVSESYPDKNYPFAYAELFGRYLLPRIFKKKKDESPDQKVLDGVGIHKNGKAFNPGFAQLKEIADSCHIPYIIYLHADREEFDNHKYNEQGDEIIKWAKANNVKLIKELDYKFTADDYRDGIHMSKSGQRKLADIMKKVIKV